MANSNKVENLFAKAIRIFRQEGFTALWQRTGLFIETLWYRRTQVRESPRCETKVQSEWPAGEPLVSVIIPCYKYGNYVRAAIESVLNQTFQHFEIMVIDDGSPDEFTQQVLRELRYEKTRVIYQANQGPAQTRNNGAAQARGKYVCFLDADDLIEPTYLEKTLTLLEADESLGTCYSLVQCFGDSDELWITTDLEPFFLRRGPTASVHGVTRKSAWESVKQENGAGYLKKYDGYFEDWVFWIDLVRCGYRGKVIEEPLIRYRFHSQSLSTNFNSRTSFRRKPGYDQMLKVLQADRRDFFHNRKYLHDLERRLNRRIYIENARINLDAPGFYKAGAASAAAVSGLTGAQA